MRLDLDDTRRRRRAEATGTAVFRYWVLPFEVLSVLLLAALVGAIVLSRLATSGAEVARRRTRHAAGGPLMPLWWPLLLAALLFAIGVYGVLARRNAVLVLMAVELMLNAVNLNFVAFDA